MKPAFNPNSTKYPDRVWFRGQWRTPEQAENVREWTIRWKREKRLANPEWAAKERELNRIRSRRRIRMRAGGIEFSLGSAPTTEDALRIREKIKREAP